LTKERFHPAMLPNHQEGIKGGEILKEAPFYQGAVRSRSKKEGCRVRRKQKRGGASLLRRGFGGGGGKTVVGFTRRKEERKVLFSSDGGDLWELKVYDRLQRVGKEGRLPWAFRGAGIQAMKTEAVVRGSSYRKGGGGGIFCFYPEARDDDKWGVDWEKKKVPESWFSRPTGERYPIPRRYRERGGERWVPVTKTPRMARRKPGGKKECCGNSAKKRPGGKKKPFAAPLR